MPMPYGASDVAKARDRMLRAVDRLPGVAPSAAHGSFALLLRSTRFSYLLDDHHGDGILAIAIRAMPGVQEALVDRDPDRFLVPAYLGAHGWISVQVAGADDDTWAEIDELLEDGWRMGATRAQLAALDDG